jgi:hypothetical protein
MTNRQWIGVTLLFGTSLIALTCGLLPAQQAKSEIDTFRKEYYGRRFGEVRREALIDGGGDDRTEGMVARGLDWLAKHEAADGRWSFTKFAAPEFGRCECGGTGNWDNDIAATGFALLAFLGAGQTDEKAEHVKVVDKAIKYLVKRQDREGAFDPDLMAHGVATLAICEAYGMTETAALKESAQRAINHIVKHQTKQGGWLANRGTDGFDTSVGTWQFLALKTGQIAGADVPRETLTKAYKWLDAAGDKEGSRYGLNAAHPETGFQPTTTSQALLCRMYLGWGPRSPGLLAGLYNHIRKHGPRADDIGYTFFSSQLVLQVYGSKAEQLGKWNSKLRDGLFESQDKGKKVEHQKGSWYSATDKDASGVGGRVLQTALSTLTLEVYYRTPVLWRRAKD